MLKMIAEIGKMRNEIWGSSKAEVTSLKWSNK